MSTKEFKTHQNEDFLEWEEVYQRQFLRNFKSEVERILLKEKM
jgi:hypothetical protein